MNVTISKIQKISHFKKCTKQSLSFKRQFIVMKCCQLNKIVFLNIEILKHHFNYLNIKNAIPC